MTAQPGKGLAGAPRCPERAGREVPPPPAPAKTHCLEQAGGTFKGSELTLGADALRNDILTGWSLGTDWDRN